MRYGRVKKPWTSKQCAEGCWLVTAGHSLHVVSACVYSRAMLYEMCNVGVMITFSAIDTQTVVLN